MRPILILTTLAALVAGPAFAADAEAVSGFYDGTAACPGGEVQILLWLDVASDDSVTAKLHVAPLKGAQVAKGDYDMAGSIDGMDWLDIKGPGKVAFAGAWFDTDADGEVTILGELAGSGCKDFNLVQQPPVGPV